MGTPRPEGLSRRERQIMDIIFSRGRATAADVRNDLPDPPSYSAVRALLRILEEKGHVTHGQESGRYVYVPTRSRRRAGRSALKRALATFFAGRVDRAVVALLDAADLELRAKDYERLRRMAEHAKRKGG